MWSVSVRCKTFGSMLDAPFDGVQVLLPCGRVPELEVVVVARDDDVAFETCVARRGSRARGCDPSGRGRPRRRRRRRTGGGRAPRATAGRAPRCGPRPHLPRLPRIDGDVAVEPAREDDAVAERVAKPGRQGEPALLVDRVLVGADEHRLRGVADPLSDLHGCPTLRHFHPLVKPCIGRITPSRPGIGRADASARRPAAGQPMRDVTRRDAAPVSAAAPQRAAKATASWG